MPIVADEQKHADDPSQLARILVCSVQKNLRHMHQQHHDHAGAGVIMQRSQKPAQRLLVIQKQQALIGFVGRGHVDQRQADAGNNLDQNSVSDALPKTYHQPIGPSIARGTGCRIIGRKVSRKPMRASNQLPIVLSQSTMTMFSSR